MSWRTDEVTIQNDVVLIERQIDRDVYKVICSISLEDVGKILKAVIKGGKDDEL